MKNEQIMLYGAGVTAEKFYCLNYQRIDVKLVIDRNAGRKFHGLPVVKLAQALSLRKNELIVITAKDKSYNEIVNLLVSVGLKENTDFIRSTRFGKKMAILYGNCHMSVLNDYLSNVPEFYDRFYLKIYLLVGSKETVRWPDEDNLRQCDLLITQDIREENRFGAPSADDFLKKIKPTGMGVKIPNLFGKNLFYPQITEWDIAADKIHIGADAVLNDGYIPEIRWIVGCRDGKVEQMIEEGMKSTEIADRIRTVDYWEKDEIINNFNKQIEQIKEREKRCDISISDYLIDNYKSIQLFYDPYHPSREVLHEMGRRVLQKLGIEGKYTGVNVVNNDGGELYIYGCVRKALKLTFEQEYIKKCNYGCTLHGRAITLEEYIEEYKCWHYPLKKNAR